MPRPEHHIEMLATFERAVEAAELFSRIADFAQNICEQVGIEDAETVINAVRERAKRAARRQLATLIETQLDPAVLESLFADAGMLMPTPRKRTKTA
jgi:hypothetical protein